MKFFLLTMCIWFSFVAVAAENPQLSPAVSSPVVLGVFDKLSKAEFETKVTPFIQSEFANCKKDQCQMRNLTPYNEKGEFDSSSLLAQIQQIKPETQVVLFNFNEKYVEKSKSIVDALEKLSASGVIIIAAAGVPAQDDSSAPLSQTIFGRVSKAIIIGELGEKYQLPPTGFFGPEMLTALRPQKEFMKQGLVPALFSTKLVREYGRRTNWYEHLQSKKNSCKKIWLEINDCFSR